MSNSAIEKPKILYIMADEAIAELNRIASLAANLTPVKFACLATFDSDAKKATAVAMSGTHTPLFAQVNASARRSHVDWHPTITVSASVNEFVKKVFLDAETTSVKVGDFIVGVLDRSLIKSTFARFNENWLYAKPVIVRNEVCGALFFASTNQLTRTEEETCDSFAEKCVESLKSLSVESEISKQIEELVEKRRIVQLNDPLGLTEQRGSTAINPRSFEDIRLSHETQSAIRGDRELNLTRREFTLLDMFLQSPELALSRVQIISRVWVERNGISSNVLNVTVKNLREKLEAAGESRVIHAVRGYGYVLKA